MADEKISTLTELTDPELADLLPIVDDPAGTPVTKNIKLDTLLSMEFGQLYTTGGSGTQTPGTTYAKLTQWATLGLSSAGITPDTTNNKITASNAGIYFVAYQLGFSGDGGSVVNACVFWNSVEQSQIAMERKLGTGGDVGSASGFGFVDATLGNTDFEVHIKTDGASDTFDLVEGQFIVVRIAST